VLAATNLTVALLPPIRAIASASSETPRRLRRRAEPRAAA
jgi:hypothetical protein